MTNWNWTPRAKAIGAVLQALAVIGAAWVLFVGTWFALSVALMYVVSICFVSFVLEPCGSLMCYTLP